MKFAILPLLLLGLVLTGCASKEVDLPEYVTVPPTGPNFGSDIVTVGDKLEIYILEDESFNGIYTVRDGGHVIFPKVGRVLVTGMNLAQAEAAIRKAFEANQLRIATVILERHGSKRQDGPSIPNVTVYLSGVVNRPGPLEVPFIAGQPPTAYQALVHGGGPGEWANLSGAYVVRNVGGVRKRINVDLKDVGKGKDQDVPIQSGDIIVVPQRGLF
jgi:protein involved in polysaccharide export with SLBB domain